MMPRIQTLARDATTEPTRKILDGVEKALGMVPNLHLTLAHAPAALAGYALLADALGRGRLDPRLRERIAVATAARNGCGYCASAHHLLGKNAGLSPEELDRNLVGESGDARAAAALELVSSLVENRGRVDEALVLRARDAGFDDGELLEIVAHVGMNTLTNLLNNFAGTEIDFPEVPLPEEAR